MEYKSLTNTRCPYCQYIQVYVDVDIKERAINTRLGLGGYAYEKTICYSCNKDYEIIATFIPQYISPSLK
jgi:hypothetical protein